MAERRFIIPQSELTEEQKKKRSKRKLWLRAASCIFFLLAMAGIIYLLYPVVAGSNTDNWYESIQQQIASYNSLTGLIIFLGIQIVQVIVAVIPAVQVVGGLLYGWFFGGILSFIGILIGTLLVWGFVKKMGAPLVEAVISEKNIRSFKFLEDDRKLIFVLIILYVIPGIPKDVVTYIVPLTKVKMKDFFLYVIPFRLPAIFLSTAFGSNAASGNYTAAIVIVSIIIVIVLVGLMFKDKILAFFNKKKSQRHNEDRR
ncbi:MAG: VTT domain-containing protein [Ruminococcus sp.]|nr:VTT domain-containing protein [Ruminococcus sp.]